MQVRMQLHLRHLSLELSQYVSTFTRAPPRSRINIFCFAKSIGEVQAEEQRALPVLFTPLPTSRATQDSPSTDSNAFVCTCPYHADSSHALAARPAKAKRGTGKRRETWPLPSSPGSFTVHSSFCETLPVTAGWPGEVRASCCHIQAVHAVLHAPISPLAEFSGLGKKLRMQCETATSVIQTAGPGTTVGSQDTHCTPAATSDYAEP